MNHKQMLEFKKSREQAKNAVIPFRGRIPTIPDRVAKYDPTLIAGPYSYLLAEANAVVAREFPEGLPRHSSAEPAGLRNYFKEARFHVLGFGHFSIALTHPLLPGKCIKLSVRKEDSGAAFAAYCRANDGNPHLPKILHIQNMSHCVAIIMPEYKEFANDYYLPNQQYIAAQNSVLAIRTDDQCRKAGVDVDGALWKTGRAIRTYFKGLAEFDMHSGNVMWDGDTLVITDPVSFKYKE